MAAASDLESKAKEAFVDDDFELAAELYTQAIDAGPATAELYADRAQAHIKLGNYTEAVADANKAIELDPSMHKAYLRKGAACIKLEEYQTAKAALELGASYASGDSRFTRLMKECDERIAEEAHQAPIKKTEDPAAAPSVASTVEEKDDTVTMENTQMVEVPSKPRFRHDFYNSATDVVLTIFAKGVPPENVVIDFGEQMLSVSIEVPGEEPYHFQPRLFSKIIPDKSKYQVLSTKVEIRLAKAEQITWTSLDYDNKPKALPQKIISAASSAQRPSYPSSKSKKDWDKIEAEVKKEEKEEKLDGDAALNKFFRDIYSDADEDMRRAMMKSFVESNGTVLSTNWKDVGAKKVEGSPPDGMELKKWEY
ncbi:protein SGT1 homolog [Oryza brachyantha]|uniref:protein SGT1 homolog n=1 Tax=Oryza brachyantha TaxID=4533 RepID=UPI001AD98131|nr:protein SGT1 homolog [Oryza brachyantha]